MNHNAFAFDYTSFVAELRPLLIQALAANESLRLMAWIEANRLSLVDPYEGKKLGESWEKDFSKSGVQEYGDIALTKYYDPTDSIGLDDTWQEVGDTLKEHGLGEEIILGTPILVPTLTEPLSSKLQIEPPGRSGPRRSANWRKSLPVRWAWLIGCATEASAQSHRWLTTLVYR